MRVSAVLPGGAAARTVHPRDDGSCCPGQPRLTQPLLALPSPFGAPALRRQRLAHESYILACRLEGLAEQVRRCRRLHIPAHRWREVVWRHVRQGLAASAPEPEEPHNDWDHRPRPAVEEVPGDEPRDAQPPHNNQGPPPVATTGGLTRAEGLREKHAEAEHERISDRDCSV